MGAMAWICCRPRNGSRAIIDISNTTRFAQSAHERCIGACANTVPAQRNDKKITALATRDIEIHELQLPPCVPGAGSKIHKDATKPNGIPIQVEESHVQMTAERSKRMTGKTPEGANASAPIQTTTHTYYVFADTRLPVWETLLDNTAVADDRRCRRAMKALDGKECMHPFWLIPRMSEKELRLRIEDTKGARGAKFNIVLERLQFGVVTSGCLMSKKTNITLSVFVPILTNSTPIKKGEELIMHVAPPPKKEKEPTTETWKTSAKRSIAAEGNDGPKKQKSGANTTAGASEKKVSLRV